jgi:pyruvate ferredoxin oxidoreductase alpha subunit
MSTPRPIGPHGARYDDAIDLTALAGAHVPQFRERTTITVDGNVAAAIPFLQWWRSLVVAGFPITPATKWLEHLAATKTPGKVLKQLESEHAVADYLVGVAASCRALITGTATSSVGLDHMTETLRSLGASGLGNVVVVNVCRATANYPLCIEGDASDTLAHRDDGFIQVMCRGKQQIYDTLLQLPAVGMHPQVLTPTMPAYFGIKDSHRSGRLIVEQDSEVNRFLDEALADAADNTPPGLLDGDTAMGNCVTSAWFHGFKVEQQARQQRAIAVIAAVARRFEAAFARKGIEPLEQHAMDDAEVALVCLGPDAGTAQHILPQLRAEMKVRIGLLVPRLLTPFPSEAWGSALARVSALGVVNHAHHHGRGHLALDLADALLQSGRAIPVESFFCGLGGADVSVAAWQAIARATCDAAARGRIARPWHHIHDGLELA